MWVPVRNRVGNLEIIRPHIFDLLDYVIRRSEKFKFTKKKKGSGGPVVRNVTRMVAETL